MASSLKFGFLILTAGSSSLLSAMIALCHSWMEGRLFSPQSLTNTPASAAAAKNAVRAEAGVASPASTARHAAFAAR